MGYKSKLHEERIKASNSNWLKKPKLRTGQPNSPWRKNIQNYYQHHKDKKEKDYDYFD